MLPDEVAGRLPIELFAARLDADVDARLATAADPLGGTQFMMDRPTLQVLRQRSPAMRLGPTLVLRGSRRSRRIGRGSFGGQRLGKEQQLGRVPALALFAIQPLQQQVQALLQAFFILPFLPQGGHQF